MTVVVVDMVTEALSEHLLYGKIPLNIYIDFPMTIQTSCYIANMYLASVLN